MGLKKAEVVRELEGGVDGKRDVEEVDRGVRDGRSKVKSRVEVREEGDEKAELFAGEGGGSYTVIYVATV